MLSSHLILLGRPNYISGANFSEMVATMFAELHCMQDSISAVNLIDVSGKMDRARAMHKVAIACALSLCVGPVY